jgi:hypothetical protein
MHIYMGSFFFFLCVGNFMVHNYNSLSLRGTYLYICWLEGWWCIWFRVHVLDRASALMALETLHGGIRHTCAFLFVCVVFPLRFFSSFQCKR